MRRKIITPEQVEFMKLLNHLTYQTALSIREEINEAIVAYRNVRQKPPFPEYYKEALISCQKVIDAHEGRNGGNA